MESCASRKNRLDRILEKALWSQACSVYYPADPEFEATLSEATLGYMVRWW